MYSLKRIIEHDEPLPLPTCMYYLKKIHSFDEDSNLNECQVNLKIVEQVAKVLKKPSQKMEDLEKRQEHLLKKLDTLYERITKISSLCKSTENTTLTKTKNVMLPEGLVISASAMNLPWYLLFLVKKNLLHVSCHIHSSLPTEFTSKVKDFMEACRNSDPNLPNLVLIFKNVGPQSELKTTTMSVPIEGDVNIIRYLSFFYPVLFKYDPDNYEADSMLDNCYLIQKYPKDTAFIEDILKVIFKQISDSWILNNQLSIVDVAFYNFVKQQMYPLKPVPKQWVEKCNITLLK